MKAPRTRRARLALGTLVEVGVVGAGDHAAALVAAFTAIDAIERAMSRQRAGSTLARLNAAPAGVDVAIDDDTAAVLTCARDLHAASGGAFDVACGSARDGCGFVLHEGHATRTDDRAALSLDGIAKGHAVDRAVDALCAAGIAAGWVNAGGDLRAFGALDLPVVVRTGTRRRMLVVRERALATSEFGRARHVRATSTLGRARGSAAHSASVIAPRCMLADALTKVVALRGRAARGLLESLGARIVAGA
jgi:FAD:protein FMN transferase